MWLFFPFGFVSVVYKPGDEPGVLCVRARDALSLDNVRARCPTLGPTLAGGGTDYPFRAYVNGADFGAFVAAYTESIDFGNFKDQTTRQHGVPYHDACMSVWGAMLRLTPPRRAQWRGNAGLPLTFRRKPRTASLLGGTMTTTTPSDLLATLTATLDLKEGDSVCIRRRDGPFGGGPFLVSLDSGATHWTLGDGLEEACRRHVWRLGLPDTGFEGADGAMWVFVGEV
jgi:hypothetical protein